MISATKPLCGAVIFSTHSHIENIEVHIGEIGNIGVI